MRTATIADVPVQVGRDCVAAARIPTNHADPALWRLAWFLTLGPVGHIDAQRATTGT